MNEIDAAILRALGRESGRLQQVNAKIISEGGRPCSPRREHLTPEEAELLEQNGVPINETTPYTIQERMRAGFGVIRLK